jgi:hypothetical protein
MWPKLSLSGSRASGTIVFRVTGAGDAIAGALVRVGGTPLKTTASGRAALEKAPARRVLAAASKKGYVGASASVR